MLTWVWCLWNTSCEVIKMTQRRKKRKLPPLENGLQETHVVQKSKPLFSLWTSELTLAEYRIGDYRIIAETQEEKVIVLIVNIGHRKEIYQK